YARLNSRSGWTAGGAWAILEGMISAQILGVDDREPQARDALAIWVAGVESVLPERALAGSVVVTDQGLVIEGRLIRADEFERVYVFGAGKAGAAMAVAVEEVLRGSRYWDGLRGR